MADEYGYALEERSGAILQVVYGQGLRGATGPAGDDGEPGDRGIAGEDGDKGDPGDNVKFQLGFDDENCEWLQWALDDPSIDDEDVIWNNLIKVQALRGYPGVPGTAGADGTDGLNGTNGRDGRTFIIEGSVPAVADLPSASDYSTGDTFILSDTSELATIVDGDWVVTGNHTVNQAALDAKADVTYVDDNFALKTDLPGQSESQVTADLNSVVTPPQPGDKPGAFATVPAGAPLANVAVDGTVEAGVFGKALRVVGQHIVAPRNRAQYRSDRSYQVLFRFERVLAPTDPAGDSVQLQINWLDADYNQLGFQTLQTITPCPAGIYERDFLFSETNLNEPQTTPAPPTGAVYAVPYFRTYGLDSETDVALIEMRDISWKFDISQLVYPPAYILPEEIIPPVPYEVARTLFVSNGGDNNFSGRELRLPFRDIERARDYAEDNPEENWSIQVYPGTYNTSGHIDVPDNVTEVVGMSGQRATVVQPTAGNEEQNVFRGGSGFMLRNISGVGWQVDDFEDPSEGFLVSFRPGATIFRAIYVDHCVNYRAQAPSLIPPPVDPDLGNPDIPRGPGIALADSAVVNQNSPFPQMMIEASTTSAPNGVGYCCKGFAFINALNTISIWPHIHFMALDGGELLLNNCASQFGDYTLWAEGFRLVIKPPNAAGPLAADALAGPAILGAMQAIEGAMWDQVVTDGFGGVNETFSRRDANTFTEALAYDVQQGRQESVELALNGLFLQGAFVAPGAEPAFISGWVGMDDYIQDMAISNEAKLTARRLFDVMYATLNNQTFTKKPSLISATAHQFNYPYAGVNRRAFFRNPRQVPQTVIQRDFGEVQFSGVDDRGKQYFTGGALVNPLTGKFEGPPVSRTINPIASRAARVYGGSR